MKKLTFLLILAMSLPLCAQTTYTAQGYGVCQNNDPISKPLYCTVQLLQNGTLQGYMTFYLNQNQTTTISSGQVWRFDANDVQNGYANDVTGTIDPTNYMIHFQFSDHVGFSGSADLGYKIQPGHCYRYCQPARVVITTGIVTFN